MTTTDNPIEAIAERIAKKTLAIKNEQNKIESLDSQIELYQRSKSKLQSTIAEKEGEVFAMVELQKEAAALSRERNLISDKMLEVAKHYDQFEWRQDMPEEEKLSSSTEYADLRDQKFAIQDRINEIVKAANKVYYRR